MRLLISFTFAFIFGGMVWWATEPCKPLTGMQQIAATLFGAACGFLIAYCGFREKKNG